MDEYDFNNLIKLSSVIKLKLNNYFHATIEVY